MASTLQLRDLLQRLNDAGLEYVVVGGIAAVTHGSPRATFDLDVCAPLVEPNLSRMLDALRGIRPRFRMRPDRMPLPDDPTRLQDFKMFCLETDLGTIDLLGDISGVGSFEEVARQSTSMNIGGVTCRVLNLD